MSDTENAIQDPSEVAALKQQCATLNSQVATLLVALTVVSLTLTAFIGLQSRRAGNDLKGFRPQVTQIKEAYQKQEPTIKNLVSKLAEYGKTHPDFEPIVKKYNLTPATNPVLPTTPGK